MRTSSNVAGLAQAFASVNKLVNIGNGSSTGSALPARATAPVAEVDTLANIIAICINSTGGHAGDGTTCGALFSLATPPGGTAPVNTIQAALNIAQNPANNVQGLFLLSTATPPFAPQLAVAPNDWTLSISYAAGGFNSPHSATIDAAGNVWIANSGNNTVTVLASTGQPVSASPLSGNGLSAPAGVAIAADGSAWIPNKGAATVSVFTGTGTVASGSPFSGNGLAAPSAIAIDAPGNVWVTNSGANSVSEFTGKGAAVQQVTSGLTAPTAIAVNPN